MNADGGISKTLLGRPPKRNELKKRIWTLNVGTMVSLGKNEDLIDYLSGKFSLLSSNLYKMEVYNDAKSELVIDLYFELLYATVNKLVRLTFTDIEAFSFYHHRSNYFYYVERYKFFKSDSSFYICLDPYEEDQTISAGDQNFILSNNVDGCFV